MPQNQKRVPMRLRRLITLSVVGGLMLGAGAFFGFPKTISDQLTGVGEGIQDLADQVQAKPVTIFDPPKYSIEEASSLWVVVNKQRPITPTRYKPANLSFPAFAKPKVQNPFGLQLRTEAAVATEQLAVGLKEAGLGKLVLNSGFRSYKNQKALYERTRDSRGVVVAEKLTARPGHSEHQLGLAADFSVRGQGCVIMTCFGKLEAGIWLAENAPKYGFILRYPKGYKSITGFQYEPWHFRYVGVELATEMKTKGIKTLEEFWKLPAASDYFAAAG